MKNCEVLAGCIFFNDKMAGMPGMTELYKTSYCLGDNSKCARYRVFKALGKGKVPADLYPNDHDKAERIIKG